MHHTPLIHPTPRLHPSAMSYATLEQPLARAPTTMSWTTEYSTEPPPYDVCDTAALMQAAYADKTSSQRRPQDAAPPAGSYSRAPAASWMSSPRRSALDLSIPHLREAILSLDSKMATLLSERDLLELRLEQAVRMNSPVQRLPNDLLSSIFSIAVLDEEDEDTIALSNLMLVCRCWREVAVNSPMLWTRIVMGTHHSIDRAILKLDRSRTAPLYICLDFSPRMEHGTVSTESIITAMELVRPAIWRWKTFHLIVPSRPQAHVALSRCKEQAPQLEVLSVRVSHSMQEDHYSKPPLSLFERTTPRLRTSSFTSFNFGWDLALLSNLRVLKLGGYWNGFSPSVDTLLKTLRSCPQLEELVLRNMSDVDPDGCTTALPEASEHDDYVLARASDTRSISLPRLRKASFYYSGNLRTRTVLTLLSFPALERIELCYLDNVSPMLEALRRQSLTVLPLRHLRIESCFFNELRFARLLPRLTSLTSLELVDVEDVTSNLMRVSTGAPSTVGNSDKFVLTEPRNPSRLPDLGLSEVDHALCRGMYVAGVGNPPCDRRVSTAAAFPCVPASNRSPRPASCRKPAGHVECVRPPPTSHVIVLGHGFLGVFVGVCVRRVGAYSVAAALCPSPLVCIADVWPARATRVHRPHALPPDQQGDGAVAAYVRRRG